MNELAYSDPEPVRQSDLPDIDRLRLHRNTTQPVGGDSDGRYDLAFLLLARPEWHRRAACRGVGADGEANIFFPDRTSNHRIAFALCASCHVFDECRAHDSERPELYGIWHGQGERARRKGRRPGRPTGKAVA